MPLARRVAAIFVAIARDAESISVPKAASVPNTAKEQTTTPTTCDFRQSDSRLPASAR